MLRELLEQMNSLVKGSIPGVTLFVLEGGIAKATPFLEEHCARVFSVEVGTERSLKAPPKNHRRTRVLFPPTIEIPIPVAAGAAEVLANLSVAVRHWTLPPPPEFPPPGPSTAFPTHRQEQTHRGSESCGHSESYARYGLRL